MNKAGTIVTASAVGIALVGWAVWVFSGTGGGTADTREVLRARARALQAGKDGGKIRESTKVRPRSTEVDTRWLSSLAAASSNKVVSVDEEEAKLSKLEKEVLAELRKAVGSYDFEGVLRAIARLGGSEKLSTASVFLRKEILKALGRFGAKGLAEVVGFLGDPDPGVAELAETTLNQAAVQIDLLAGDHERAETIQALSKVVTDDSTLDMMFSQVHRMRNSVGAETIEYVMKNGTPEAQQHIKDVTTVFTGDSEIDTPEEVAAWKTANPDGENDNERFRGRKSLSDMKSPTDFFR